MKYHRFSKDSVGGGRRGVTVDSMNGVKEDATEGT